MPNALPDIVVKYTSTKQNPGVVFALDIPHRLVQSKKAGYLDTTVFQEE